MTDPSHRGAHPELRAAQDDLQLTTVGGEFVDRARETSFRRSRMEESRRHARLLFAASIILNALFLLSDWRFAGTSHFVVAVSARFAVVAVSLLCLVAVQLADTARLTNVIYVVWQWGTALAVAVLVSSGSDLALFVVLLLPTVYYLVVPLPFPLLAAGGVGCSVLMLVGYLDASASWQFAVGLGLALCVLNATLILAVARANRIERQYWAAVQAERYANDRLRASEDLLENTFQAVPMPLVVVGLDDGRHIKSNEAARRFYGGSGPFEAPGGLCSACLGPDAARDLLQRSYGGNWVMTG